MAGTRQFHRGEPLMKLVLPVLAFAIPFALTSPVAAQENQWSVTPYVWLPNIDGNLNFRLPSGVRPEVGVGPNDYLENLDMALMVAGEYRGDNWSIFTDLIYLDFSNESASVRTVSGPGPVQIPIDVGSQVNFKGALWTLGGGYELVDREEYTLELLAGFRYLRAEAQLNWSLQGPLNQFPQAGSVDAEEDIWDGLVGFRGEARAGNWFFPYYADVGAGTSDLTWQASAGVGYRFGGWDIRGVYRHLRYEQDDDSLIDDLTFSGPAIGANFTF
jgi:hypothetical protein